MSVDKEILERYKPEPVTDKETEAMEKITAIDFAIQSNRLQAICEEGKEVLTRLGVSEPLQAGDCIVGIYNAQGDMACAVAGTYLHVAAGIIPIKYVIKHLMDDPTVGVKDGDMFFCNEAIYGGIHNPDMLQFLPVFYEDELVCWVLTASHEPDTGGIKPGGVIPSAKTRYDEGLKVTPMKIGKNFSLSRDVMDFFKNMVRDERPIAVDTAAKATVCYKVRERILEVLDEKGGEFLVGLLRMLVDATVGSAREKVSRLIEGIYRCVVFADNVGSELSLIRLYCTVQIKDERIKVDFTGCSPPVPYSLNTFPHIVRANVATILCQYLMGDMPVSAGVLEVVDVYAPENTLLNPPLDVAISGSQFITPQAVRAIHQCLNKAMFGTLFREYVSNPLGAAARVYFYGGKNQMGIEIAGVHASILNSNGGGARTDKDGIDSCGFWWSGAADALDTEHEELQYPLLCLFRKLPMDQHGPGKYRGGAGASGAYIVHDTSQFYLCGGGPNVKFPVEIGLFGGYASGCAPVVDIMEGSNIMNLFQRREENIPFNFHDLVVKKPVKGRYNFHFLDEGNIIPENGISSIMSIGGAGYGDVLERDVDLV
ncbi:MAG: hydantoinase B/oxoprolinase family protein, partial [Deltaproteobacteria bacterium]|nr:hydantoinase B/oxoprolinase family protein [Deltaproteobacteria bacterium]